MGRGRAKAKQVKVARQLKYSGGGFDVDQLRAEFGVGTDQQDADDHAAYADFASSHSVDDEDDEDDYDLDDEDDVVDDLEEDDLDEDDLDDDDLEEDDLDGDLAVDKTGLDAGDPAREYPRGRGDGASVRMSRANGR